MKMMIPIVGPHICQRVRIWSRKTLSITNCSLLSSSLLHSLWSVLICGCGAWFWRTSSNLIWLLWFLSRISRSLSLSLSLYLLHHSKRRIFLLALICMRHRITSSWTVFTITICDETPRASYIWTFSCRVQATHLITTTLLLQLFHCRIRCSSGTFFCLSWVVVRVLLWLIGLLSCRLSKDTLRFNIVGGTTCASSCLIFVINCRSVLLSGRSTFTHCRLLLGWRKFSNILWTSVLLFDRLGPMFAVFVLGYYDCFVRFSCQRIYYYVLAQFSFVFGRFVWMGHCWTSGAAFWNNRRRHGLIFVIYLLLWQICFNSTTHTATCLFLISSLFVLNFLLLLLFENEQTFADSYCHVHVPFIVKGALQDDRPDVVNFGQQF